MLEQVQLPVAATPSDLEVLPDGTIFVAANVFDTSQALLLEVDLDGTVLDAREFDAEDYGWPILDALTWDPTHELLYLAGEGTGGGSQQPWRAVLDREGTVLFDEIDVVPDLGIATALEVATVPGGGFVETRFGGGLQVFRVDCE